MTESVDSPNSASDFGSASGGTAVLTRPETAIPRTTAPQRPPQRPADAAPAIGPKQILHALRRRWLTILAIGAPLALVGMYAMWKLFPTPYTAATVLRFSANEPRLVFDTAENPPDFDTYRSTQMDMIRSRLVLNHVLQRPEVAALPMVQSQPFPLLWLENELKLEGMGSREFLKIAISGSDPVAIATIANAVADSYLEKVVNAEKLSRAERLANLERILRETNKAVEDKETHVRKLAETLGTGDSKTLTIKQQMASEYFAQLRREHARVRFELMRAQVDAQADLTWELNENDPSAVPELIGNGSETPRQLDPETVVLGKRINELHNLIARFRKTVVAGSHPAIQEYQAEYDQLLNVYRRRVAAIQQGRPAASTDPANTGNETTPGNTPSRIDILARQERLLREEAERLGDMLKDIGASTFDLQDMQDELKQESRISNELKSEIETLRIELQSPSRATISERAEPPKVVSVSKKKKITLAGGMAICGLVLGLFVGWDLLGRRVADAEEITEQTGLPVLGQLPKTSNLLSRWNPAADRWPGPLSEAADSVRALLGESLPQQTSISVLVTGASAKDGATTLACQLARSYARSGKRTLLVDANLRRPAVHDAFKIRSEPGLADVVRGEADMIDAASLSEQDRLWLLPAGCISDDALRRLTSDDAVQIWEKLTRHFDAVVVDSAGILEGSETTFIARSLQATVFAVRRDQTRQPEFQQALKRLRQLSVPVAGAVLLEAPGRGIL